jgi:sodium-dependent phosphate cotransporter
MRRALFLLIALYAFFVSIALLSESFEFLGEGVARRLLETADNPFVGLFIGILATSMVQSSSTVTSITVGLVAGGALDVPSAIPVIMGSNMGTSVTNAVVAAGQIGKRDEFERAFAAAVVDDFFEILSIVVLFPLQLTTNFLGRAAGYLSETFAGMGGLEWGNPLQAILDPVVGLLTSLLAHSGLLMMVVALLLLVLALHQLVKNLKAILVGRIEVFVDRTLFKTAWRAMALGFALTVLVQSSSVTTSLVVPLAGIGLVSLAQAFPYALGANVGTTTTAILAALVTGNEEALAVALAHLLYNVAGIIIVWPVRIVPLRLAQALAKLSIRSKLAPLLYVTVVFFGIPFALIYFAR